MDFAKFESAAVLGLCLAIVGPDFHVHETRLKWSDEMHTSQYDWSRILTCTWIVLSTVSGLLTLVPWFVVLMMTPLLFDAGWSEESARIVLIVFGYPLLPLGVSGLAWLLFGFKRHRSAAVVAVANFIPIAWVIVVGSQG